jgi:hypothetical protein
LSIADALKNARGMPRIIKAGGGGGGVKRPPPLHSSSQEQDIPVSLSRVSSKREKYLKVAKTAKNNEKYRIWDLLRCSYLPVLSKTDTLLYCTVT